MRLFLLPLLASVVFNAPFGRAAEDDIDQNPQAPVKVEQLPFPFVAEPDKEQWQQLEDYLLRGSVEMQVQVMWRLKSMRPAVKVPDRIVQRLLQLLRSDEMRQNLAVSLIATRSPHYPFNDEEFADLLSYVQTAEARMLQQLSPLLPGLGEQRNRALAKVFLERVRTTDPEETFLPSTLLFQQLLPYMGYETLEELYDRAADPDSRASLLFYFPVFAFRPQMEKRLFEALASPGKLGTLLRFSAASVFARTAAQEKHLIPLLIERAGSNGEDRFAAARALIFLSPVVPKQPLFAKVRGVYVEEQDPRRKLQLLCLASFADPNQPEEKRYINEAIALLDQAQKGEEGSEAIFNLFNDLVPFIGGNKIFFRDVFEKKLLEIRSTEFLWALLDMPPEKTAKQTPFVSALKSLASRPHTPLYFSSSYFLLENQLPHLDRTVVSQNLSALVDRLEDSTEPLEFRQWVLQILSVSGPRGVPFLPRLLGIQDQPDNQLGLELDRAILILREQRKKDFINRSKKAL